MIDSAELEILAAATPRGHEPTALIDALRATTGLYDQLRQDRWPASSRMVLADQITAVINGDSVD